METIAVGLDGSAASAAALLWTVDLAVTIGARVVGINAFHTPWTEPEPLDRQQLKAERKEQLERDWLGPAAKAGLTVDSVISDGDPRDVVLDAARTAGADLLVLGRIGSGGGPGFLHLGSLAEYAAHHAALPVAVIPAGAPTPIGRIVVGVDGSTESRQALAWAGDVAKATESELVAVQVMEPFLEWTPVSSPDNWRRDVEHSLTEWAKPLTDSGVSVVPLAQRDLHPADGLIGVAASRQADLVVVGTRGLGGFLTLRAGGVALKILHRIGLPLVLVPPTQRVS
ncbi:MAG: universal stress protein [Acidimicrobiia bacterium]|nr:universal stress protein [Acidimicrobiia bacterium]